MMDLPTQTQLVQPIAMLSLIFEVTRHKSECMYNLYLGRELEQVVVLMII